MKFLWVIIISIFSTLVQAQTLQRKASLGARIEPSEQGVLVLEVMDGTAVSLQLAAQDIITEAHQTAIKDVSVLMSVIAEKRAGEEASFTVLRKGKSIRLKGTYSGKPLETSDISEVIYDQAPYKNGQLRVIINKPDSEGLLPAMLFIPGYTCSSLDNLPDYHPYKRIIDAYVQAGFVTLRIEKSGLGDSFNTPPCESCDLMDEIENFHTGLKHLQSLPYVDTTKIILVGHSMGGIVAPAISSINQVAGVVVYGTTAKSWFEYQIEMYRVQNLLVGMDPLEYEQSVRDQYELNYRYFVKNEALIDLAKNPHFDTLLRQQWMYDGEGRIFSRNAEYWRQIQDVNHLENWKNTLGKVLVQFGESDFQAFSRADHEQIVNTVNYYRPGTATLQVFPSTDHYFAQSGSMQDAYDKFVGQQYMQLFNEYNTDVGEGAVRWSLDVIDPMRNNNKTALTWQKLNTEPYPGKQDDICFINEQTGWYVNGYGKIYKTTDSGNTWDKVYERQGSFFRTIAFLDENIGFVGTVGTDYFPNVTDTIPLYKTTDGGHSWTPVDYSGPYVKGLCAIDIVQEAYINHGVTDYKYHLYAVGRVGSPANILISHDAGATWTSHSMQEDAKMLFDITMFDKNNGIVCAANNEDISHSNALILKTSDGGKTWKKVYQSSRPFETTWKASFPSPLIGYVTIQSYHPDPSIKQQRIAKTIDGGKTWTEINLVEDAQARQFGIGFVDDLHGYVGTMTGGWETKDGGRTWSPTDLGRACNKIRIYRESGRVYGYAIGVDVFKLKIDN